MKRKTSFAVAIWWVLACAIAGIFLMCTSEKESRVSEAENRMLQGFPKLSLETVFNDEFTTQFDAFLADSFFGRDGVVSFTNGLLDTFSVLSKDDAMAAKTAEMESDLQNANLQVEEEVSLDQIPGVVDTSVSEAAPAVEEDEPEEDGELIVADGEVPITADHSYLYFEMTDGSLKKI